MILNYDEIDEAEYHRHPALSVTTAKEAWEPVKIYDLGELDALEEARADAAEAAHAAALEER